MSDRCPCGSGSAYESCCEPFIRRDAQPETAEQCMRSRFTAYARGQVDYLVYSHAPETRSPRLREAVKEWARRADFRTLRVVDKRFGTATDDRGFVEFEADYEEGGQTKTLKERSEFTRHDGRWVYLRGKAPTSGTLTRDARKVGRNDPCPCGSGKKFKKCCG